MTTAHKPLLVATDLTARCDRPIDRAYMLAKQWKVKLNILHVLDPIQAKEVGIKSRSIETQIREELPEGDVVVEIVVRAGLVANTILEVAKRKGCGLIVVGVARYDSIGDIFLGNPVDQLVQSAHIPVLIVKRKPLKPYKNIVVATDFSDCSLFALNKAAELFSDPILHLVHAHHESHESWLKSEVVKTETKSEEQALMDRFLAKRAITDETFDRLNASIETGEFATIVMSKIEKTRSDLIVLGAHGRSGFSAASIGSKAKNILGWAKQDILLVSEPR